MKNTGTKQSLNEVRYGFFREVPACFDDAVKQTTEALQTEGFGVLSEIRIDEKLKEKLGADFRKYVILGACNPPLAYRAVTEDINIGLLLPCNVVVYESDDPENSVVAAVDANAMMSVVGSQPEIVAVAKDANQRLRRVLESL